MSIAISGSTITFSDLTQMSTAATAATGFRNKLINGDFRLDQRNAGAVVTVNTGGPSYTLDRWVAYQNSPSTGVQVSRTTTVPSGFQHSIKWGRNGSGTAGGTTVLAQALETSNCFDAQGGVVTLSFYAKAGANFSGASSQIGVRVISGTGTNQSIGSMVTFAWTGSATPINSAATLTTSWQRFTFTSTTLGASVSQLGVYLNWTTVGSAGADDNVYITGVQLEVGSSATDFERRPIGTELTLCQRYFETNYQPAYAVGANSGVEGCWFSISLNGTDFYDYGRLTFLVPKLTNPVVGLYNPIAGTGTFYDLNTGVANGNTASRYVGVYGAAIYTNTGFSANHVYAARYTADAEL